MSSAPILVLGSNSFSGAAFVDYLLSQGLSVIGTSRSPEPHAAFLPYKNNPNLNKFKFVQTDINHDLTKLIDICSGERVEYFVNFAAQSMVAESWTNPEHWFETNVVANVKMHDRLRKLPSLKKYVHISTPEVYGSCSGLVEEDFRFNPSTPYAVSRAAADMSLLSFQKNYGFPVVFTRAANVYGPGQQLYRIIPRTMLYIRLGKKIQLHGGGHSVRSFIHIRDVAEGTWRATLEGQPPACFHFSTSLQISIRELVEKICVRMKVPFAEAVEVVGDRPGKDAAYLLSSRKAETELGWKAKIGLEQGLEETLAWIDKNLNELRSVPHDYIHKP